MIMCKGLADECRRAAARGEQGAVCILVGEGDLPDARGLRDDPGDF